jgi:hypothetical protein
MTEVEKFDKLFTHDNGHSYKNKTGIDRFQDCWKTGYYGYYGYCGYYCYCS